MISYSPVGDLIVVTICIVMMILLLFSYVKNSRSYKLFLAMIIALILAALTDVLFHNLANYTRLYNPAYAVRCVFHAILFLIFILYTVYIAEVTRLEKRIRRPFYLSALLIFLIVVTLDIMNTLSSRGIRITPSGIEIHAENIFIYGYVAFLALLLALLAVVHKRLYRRVMLGFYGTIAVSFVILLVQGIHSQTSFTVATFLYPVLGMLYFLHSNPYDARLGAVDRKAFEEVVQKHYERQTEFGYVSMQLCQFEEEQKEFPDEIQALIRDFSIRYFRGSLLFQISKGHAILLFMKKRNPDYEEKFKRLMSEFHRLYEKYRYDYKFVIGSNIDEISRKNEYVGFICGIQKNMIVNSVHRVGSGDVDAFNRKEYIRRELADIYRKRDMNDPRIQVYCQPVYNLSTGRYDTAEALMRLILDETGMVFPDQFIPLAEENGYIHVMTEILLNKTCRVVKELVEKGYDLKRVSVNVSVLELKEEDFCEDIESILRNSEVERGRIAIELTESQTESDFALMKQKIEELKHEGIKFYLDDFGTGYSNMERIMELPFDIIKFDRSMVLASEGSERSRMMVLNLANLFASLEYAVLYEGIEEEADEAMCRQMSASYLQGYRYSKPIPIEQLSEFCIRRQSAAGGGS